MNIQTCTKAAFSVIGKEGAISDGNNRIPSLWADANSHFEEIAHLAKRDETGNLVGIWGAMSDCSRGFLPWEENFTKGLYLAGVECAEDALPPVGWTKWAIPGFVYLVVPCDSDHVFRDTIAYLEEQGIPLVGAVQDFTDPKTGGNYMLFPTAKL